MLQNFTKTKKEVGFVFSTRDYIINLNGLPSAKMYDIVVTKNGGRALVSALNKENVEVLMLDAERPKPGDYLELSEKSLSLPFNLNLFGRVVNPLGTSLDGKAALPAGGEELDLDTVAPGIDGRDAIRDQFYTGLSMIDTLIPVGVGQRELVLCEPRSGKDMFFLDVIVNQKQTGCICVYCAIGQSEVDVKRFSEELHRTGADAYTVIVAATSNESAPMIIIAPSVAMSLAEFYRNQGRNVLVILDDLATHAKYSREISLLAGRVPGRESYPADIFYQHSSLLERGGKFNDHHHKGTITLLPVVETPIENFTNLIPTNVMSITDGHILFSAQLRAQGIYPAIEADRSVTRVGRQTQMFIHKVLSDKVRSLLAEYHELERYGRFGSELSGETQLKIKRGRIAEELLKQEPLTPIPADVQILYLSLVFAGYFDERDFEGVRSNKGALIDKITKDPAFTALRGEIKTIKFDQLVEKLKGMLGPLESICPRLTNSKQN